MKNVTIACMLLGLAFAGCHSFVDGAKQSITVAENTIATTTKVITQYDLQMQQGIVAKATDQATVKAQLTQYRNDRAAVVKAVADAQSVVLAGAALIPLVESGVKSQTDLSMWLGQLGTASTALISALHMFGVNLPAGL